MHFKHNIPGLLRALIVEDSADDFLLLTDFLKGNGVKLVAERVDNEESLSAALQENWDVVFSDYTMPRLNGLRALEIVRAVDQQTPFIYVSGTIGEVAAVQAIKSGAQDYVMKTDLPRLLPTVERELKEAENRREQEAIKRSLEKLMLAIQQTADSVFITDHEGKIEFVNPTFESLTGYSWHEAVGQPASLLRSDYHKESTYKEIWETISQGKTFKGTIINRRKDNSQFYEEKVISPVVNSEGVITNYVSTGRDISSRIEAEIASERLQNVLNTTPDFFAIFKQNGNIMYLNHAARDLLNLSENFCLETASYEQIFSAELSKQLKQYIFPEAVSEGCWTGEIDLQSASSDLFDIPVSLVVQSHHNHRSRDSYLSFAARDISERKEFEARLQHQATHDSLTGLPNRYYLIDRLKNAIHGAERREKSIAVLFMDLNKFKQINDSMGHEAGDKLLKEVSLRLKKSLRPMDTIARLGGDEFTIVIEDINRPEAAISVLNKIFNVFNEPVLIEGKQIFACLSVGVALYPQDGKNEMDLLKNADTAMYQAKSQGSNQYQFYSPKLDAKGHELIDLEADLRKAVANKQLYIDYQPQINVRSGAIEALEALIRWDYPKQKDILPTKFIPLLESSGLIHEVGNWIIEQACIHYRQFFSVNNEKVRVSLNLSEVQIFKDGFVDNVRRLVDKYAMPDSVLEFEIAESTVMKNPARIAEILVALHEIGVRAAIDNFGKGYYSLAYLKRFHVDTLKIDCSHLSDLVSESSDKAVIEASVTLGHKLGMQVVAEHVESKEQFAYLESLQCDMAQGYWFGKPASCSDIAKQMKAQNTH